ncbi:MAG TPA: nuclear transport factor 2 family protein [Sneathiellales bacterium]|jgi:ketosteroid isomerase-like protein|nr:nuclear transport factor 2 family protein [Sneathiellales bacterium]
MSADASKQVVSDFYRLLSEGDSKGAVALLSDDIVWVCEGTTPVSGRFSGLKSVLEDFFSVVNDHREEGITFNILEMFGEGDSVVALVEGFMTGKHGPYNNLYCQIYRVCDGKIYESLEYLDTALVETALFGKKITAA